MIVNPTGMNSLKIQQFKFTNVVPASK